MKNHNEDLSLALLSLGSILILGALCIWGFFAYLWLKNGFWPSYTAIDLACLAISCAPDSWAYTPSDWVGVHKAVTWLSPAGLCFSLGMFFAWLGTLCSA